MIAGSMVWATYALAQKQLLTHYSSAQVLFMIYIGSIPLLLPWSHVSQLARTRPGAARACWRSAASTPSSAYGCFAEALDHWQVSRIGAVVALAPLLTIAFVHLLAALWPAHFAAEPLTARQRAGCLPRGGRIDHVRARRRGGRADRCDAGDQPGRDSARSRRVNQASPISSLAMGPDPTSALVEARLQTRESLATRAATWLRRSRRCR